jgi:hypothetical protein
MSHRKIIFLAAVAALGIACISADAEAARVAARGGAVAGRGAAIGARGGAVAGRGAAIGARGGALATRGGLYDRGFYRPGLGVATGAVVGGAIAASQYGYGGYGGYYGSDQPYAAGSYPPDYSYGNGGYGYNSGPGPYGYDPGYSAVSYSPYGYGGAPGYWQSCTYVGGPKSDWICR